MPIDAVTVQVSGPEGTDAFTDVENFQFTDQTQTFAELVFVPVFANLTASGLTITDAELVRGESLIATRTISASATIDAGASTTSLVVATAADLSTVGKTVGSVSLGALAPGAAVGVSLDLSGDSLAPGTCYLAAIADDGNLIAEMDEADNLTTWTSFTVIQPVYNLDLSAGDDDIPGSDGFDTVDYSSLGAGVFVDAPVPSETGTTTDVLFDLDILTGQPVWQDLLHSVEKIIATEFDDTVFVGPGAITDIDSKGRQRCRLWLGP